MSPKIHRQHTAAFEQARECSWAAVAPGRPHLCENRIISAENITSVERAGGHGWEENEGRSSNATQRIRDSVQPWRTSAVPSPSSRRRRSVTPVCFMNLDSFVTFGGVKRSGALQKWLNGPIWRTVVTVRLSSNVEPFSPPQALCSASIRSKQPFHYRMVSGAAPCRRPLPAVFHVDEFASYKSAGPARGALDPLSGHLRHISCSFIGILPYLSLWVRAV